MPMHSSSDLAHDSLVGLSVGDALGAAYEGLPFNPTIARDLTPPPGVRMRWTDDTQMTLSVVETLQESGGIDQDRLARAFARRYEPGRGYGAGMHVLLSRLIAGEDWRRARFAVFPDGSFGNGSAMRVAPLGAFLAEQEADVVKEQAARSAEVTHAHPEGVAGAVAVALAASLAARSRGQPAPPPRALFDTVLGKLGANPVAEGLRAAQELPADTPLPGAVSVLGNGSRVSCADTVPLALWIAFGHLDDYRTAVEMAVAAGGDTDTMAAIVGGVVASRVGVVGVPAEWRDAVEPLSPAVMRPTRGL
jgi:ADP-ribosylglycohydrolase